MNEITLTDFEITRMLFAMALLLAAAHGMGYFFQRLLRAPKVIGEIIGGLILGPTIFGFFFPSAQRWIFQAFTSEGPLLAMLYWMGLVLLMFISGFEIQKSITKEDRTLAGALLVGATAIPFSVGWWASKIYDFSPYLGANGNMFSLTLIIAIAVAVTSIPVNSKIFMDMGIMNTRFAKIVLTVATVQDSILWVALAMAMGFAGGAPLSVSNVVAKVFMTLSFFVLALGVMPKIFESFSKSCLNLLIKASPTGYLLFVCFLFSALARIFDVNIIFGAFLAGIVVTLTSNEKVANAKNDIKEMGVSFFIPLYFAIVGLKLDLVHHFDLWFFLGFLLFSMLLEITSTVMVLRAVRQDWLSSFNFGVAMNARGGPGIILATVCFDRGLISETFFVTLILIAMVTSLAAGYWFRFVLSKGWSLLHEPVAQ